MIIFKREIISEDKPVKKKNNNFDSKEKQKKKPHKSSHGQSNSAEGFYFTFTGLKVYSKFFFILFYF